jgi:hypothetical protein
MANREKVKHQLSWARALARELPRIT